MLSNFMNKPGGRITKSQQDEVLQLIRDNDRSVTVVDCGKELDEEFVAEVCKALRGNRYVTTLRIRERELGYAIDALAALCAKTTTLVNLKISYASMTDHDADILFGSLLGNKSIQNLALDHNRISTHDSIAMLLMHNKVLDTLDLSYNNLGAHGDRTTFAIAEALGRNTGLKQLYLSGNGLSDAAARKLVEVLDANGHTIRLRVLDIAGENSVRAETKQSLKLVLEACRQLQQSRTDDADELRSQLTGLGLQTSASVLAGGNPVLPGNRSDTDGISHADMQAWQEQVDVTPGQFDEERKELQGQIEKLKDERNQTTKAQIAALEQANKLNQQVAVLTERNSSLQKDLDKLSAKYEKKVKDSADQIENLKQQLNAAHKELVEQQEAASADRLKQLATLESMRQEVELAHEQLAAATKANDLLDQIAPPTQRKPIKSDASVLTDLTGLSARQTLVPQSSCNAGPKPAAAGPTVSRRSTDDTWSDSGGSKPPQLAVNGATPRPDLLPKDQWLDDESADDCKSCRQHFTLTRRKHHCRICGQLFCKNCCPEHKGWNVRACTFCIAAHTH
jgi:hypothetical protein